MHGLTEPFVMPYALALGASAFEAGLLASARNLLLSVIQLASGAAIGWVGSRRRLVWTTAALQAALLLPLAVVQPVFGAGAVAALIVLYTLGTGAAALGTPAWGSLVSEYVPEERRGVFFGRRARIWGVWASIASLVAGVALDWADTRPLLGFAALCVAASLARALSVRELLRLHEDPWQASPHLTFSFWRFIRQVGRSNFARFSVCLAAANMTAFIAAPYFVVYLLQELKLGYVAYTAIVLAGSVTGVLTSTWWGGVGDRLGNQAVVRWTMVGVSLLPAGWALFPDPFALAALNALGAFLWAGLNLSSTNFLYDAVTPAKRHTCLAYFNVLNGVGVSAGALLGGFAVDWLPPVHGSTLVSVFWLSVVLRLLVGLSFRRLVREVRHVEHVRLQHLLLDQVDQGLVQVSDFLRPPVRPESLGRRRRRAARADSAQETS